MPTGIVDYYKILQVDPSAEDEVIKAAYKRLALKYHPDTNKSPDASQRMKEINEAYQVLSNPTKRASYDITHSGSGGRQAPNPETASRQAQQEALDAKQQAQKAEQEARTWKKRAEQERRLRE